MQAAESDEYLPRTNSRLLAELVTQVFAPGGFRGRFAEEDHSIKTRGCPGNIARFIPALPGYVYAQQENVIFVNLFVAGSAEIALDNGLVVRLNQETRYPWDGRIKLTLDLAEPGTFAMKLCIPGWARGRWCQATSTGLPPHRRNLSPSRSTASRSPFTYPLARERTPPAQNLGSVMNNQGDTPQYPIAVALQLVTDRGQMKCTDNF